MIDVQAEQQRVLDELEELNAMKREFQQLRAEGRPVLAQYRKFRKRMEALHARVCLHADELEQRLR